MLNESDSPKESPPGIVIAPVQVPMSYGERVQSRLRAAVDTVMMVETEETALPAPLTAAFTGRLTVDSLAAYDKLDVAFKELDHVAVLAPFGDKGEKQIVRAIRGRFNPPPRPWWPNAVLFGLTVLSVLYTGATMETGGDLNSVFDLLRGWPFALGLMLILGAHELGHYFAARHHKVAVTLPYFIPLPFISPMGTMGAFIQLREPMRNRRVLLDVGAAGPLAGMLFAIPVLLIGLKTSPLMPSALSNMLMLKPFVGNYFQEGNSLLYLGAKFLLFGRMLPNDFNDVFINQLAFAGWTGLLVTSLNLIPIGQLDGGHTLYSLIGERARRLYMPALAVLLVLSLLSPAWLWWLVLLMVFGRTYAVPLDSVTKLDRRRVFFAILTLVVFVLVFMPIPAQEFAVGR